MSRTQLAIAVFLVSLLAATSAGASVFTGSLTSADGGIVATPYWETVTLGWTVTELVDGTWRYNYDLLVSQDATQAKNISHMLIETSLGFKECDILATNWVAGTPSADDIEVQEWTSQEGNPNIPGSLYGIKFNTVSPLPGSSTGTHWLLQFDTTRAPVWGDFYAKDGNVPGGGGVITAWNAGFLLTDPTAAPADGSISNKLLRPDTKDTLPPPVPEFSASALASLVGLISIVGTRLKRRK